MAVFNPDVPIQGVPNFLGYSKPIDQPISDKSAGIQLSGLGDLINNTVNVADTTIKSVIDNAIRQGVEREREGFTGALEEIGGIPQSQRVADYQPNIPSMVSQTEPMKLISGSEAAPIPAGVTQGISALSRVHSAGISGGLPSTYYYGRLDQLAKDVRTQFPGYVDYIDAKVSQMTGGNPANQYMKALLSGIKSAQTDTRSDMQKALALIGANAGIEGADLQAKIISSGQVANPVAHVIEWMHKWKSVDVKNDRAIQELNLSKANAEDKKRLSTEKASGVANAVFNASWTDTVKGLGKTWDELSQMSYDELQKLSQGSDANAQQLGQSAQLAANNIAIAIRKRLNDPAYSSLKQADKDQIVEQYTTPFNTIAKNFLDKEFGVAHAKANFITAKTSDTGAWLLKDSSIAENASLHSAVKKLYGEAAAAPLLTAPGGPFVNMPKVVKEWANHQKMKLLTDPNATLKGVLEDLKKKSETPDENGITHEKDANLGYQYLVTEVPTLILSNKLGDAAKIKYITSVFSPGNDGLVSLFENDKVNDKGQLIPGKHSIFQSMTNPKIADEVWRLSQNNPQLWQMYKNWTDRTADELLREDVKSFSEIALDPDVKLTYNTDKHEFGVVFGPKYRKGIMPLSSSLIPGGASQYAATHPSEDNIRKGLAFINSVVGSKAYAYTKEGSDPNAAILNYLVHGLNLDPHGVDMPSELLKAIIGPGPQKKEEGKKESSLTNPSVTASPGAALDTAVKGIAQKLGIPQIPALEDWTKATIGEAKKGQIKGAANAATVSEEWGNPLDTQNFHTNHITSIKTPSGQEVNVNKKAAKAFEGFLKDLEATGYEIKSIGGYNLRMNKSDPRRLSQHAFGNAIDINPEDNPFVRGKKGKTNLPANISDIAAKWGISWGGDWSSVKDTMHFEYTGITPDTPGYKMAKKDK